MSGGSFRAADDEPLEQQIDLGRIDAGDADAVADRRIRGRAAALAQNAARAGEFHEIVNRQEIGLELQLLDELKLMLDQRRELFPERLRDTVRRPAPGEFASDIAAASARRARLRPDIRIAVHPA